MVPDDSKRTTLDNAILNQVNAAIEQVEKQTDAESSVTIWTVWARVRRVTG